MINFENIIDPAYSLSIPDSVCNMHLLLTGQSGSGKSTAEKDIEIAMSAEGKHVLVLDVGGSHEDVLRYTEKFHVVKVKDEGVPLPLLEPLSFADGSVEDIEDVIESVIDALLQFDRIGYKQGYLLRKACERAILARERYDDDIKSLLDAIQSLEDEESEILLAKYGTILKRIRFDTEKNLWEDGKTTILDFSGYQQRTQVLLGQLVLSILWREHRANGQQSQEGTWVVIDEFQNLPLKKDSVLAQILREGRKYKLSLILATQTLSGFDVKQRALLQQPATKLYFRPIEADLQRISKGFQDISSADARTILQNLRIGECLINGEFQIGSEKKNKTLKIAFKKLNDQGCARR